MAEIMFDSGCSPDDMRLLIDRVAELERVLANANRYLDACREEIGAREGELLLDAIRRRLHQAPRPARDDG